MSTWFLDGWRPVAGVIGSTAVMYVVTVAAVRVAGRRTVAELSAFDVVVTVALGSIVATTAVARNPAVAEGVAAVATLLVLQVILAWARRRSVRFEKILAFSPERVVQDGELRLPSGLMSSQLTEEELRSRLRTVGVALDESAVVILEPTGDISLLRRERA